MPKFRHFNLKLSPTPNNWYGLSMYSLKSSGSKMVPAGNKPDIFLYPILIHAKDWKVAQKFQQNLLGSNNTALNLAQPCFLITILKWALISWHSSSQTPDLTQVQYNGSDRKSLNILLLFTYKAMLVNIYKPRIDYSSELSTFQNPNQILTLATTTPLETYVVYTLESRQNTLEISRIYYIPLDPKGTSHKPRSINVSVPQWSCSDFPFPE